LLVKHVRRGGNWSTRWVGTSSPEVQAKTTNGGLLHVVRRLLRRQSIAR
jgi:hypothetical protein